MPLPKISYPLFEATLPSTEKKIYYRQMLVSDEKILLMAKASEDETDIYRAVKQVVNNCLVDVDIDRLTTFDIEYLFIKIRSVSIGNEVDLSFKDLQDSNEYTFTIDLEEVEVVFPEGVEPLVMVNDNLAIKMRYPPASLFDDEKAVSRDDDAYEWIASRCIESISTSEDTYTPDDCTDEELLQYILDLDTKSYNKIREFISRMPRLEYIVSYTNKEGTPRKLALTTLTDFFTLR